MTAKHRASRTRTFRTALASLIAVASVAVGFTALSSPAALAASGLNAVGTTTDIHASSDTCLYPNGTSTPCPTSENSNQCNNGAAGSDPTNCNSYVAKTDVWLSGLPQALGGETGNFFFAVIAPGGQPNPTDALYPNGKLLSTDTQSQRTFSMSTGSPVMTDNSSTHVIDSTQGKIQIAPFLDSPNGGGVYILAICQLNGDGSTGACKYDAFKVGSSGPTIVPLSPLTVSKTAAGTYTDAFTWSLNKVLDATQTVTVDRSTTPPTFSGNTGTIPVKYDVNVTITEKTYGFVATGTVTVTNPNSIPVTATVTENGLSDGTSCTFDGTTPAASITQSMAPGNNAFNYTCTYPATQLTVPSGVTNSASVNWTFQSYNSTDGTKVYTLDPPATPPTTGNVAVGFTGTKVDTCITLSDTIYTALNGTTDCVGDPTLKYTYTINWAIPASGCNSADTNTASFVTNDTQKTGQSSMTIQVCRAPLRDGALTQGFWHNKNGQGIITNQASSGTCPSGTWLRQFAPFQDLSASATCSQVAAYQLGIFNAATAGGSTENPMLKSQMLATALDVYFSDPSLGGNKIGAPKVIGSCTIDLTQPFNAGPAFNGKTSDTVLGLLTYAASQSNAGGSNWYGQIKSTQDLAQMTFNDINNQTAYGAC